MIWVAEEAGLMRFIRGMSLSETLSFVDACAAAGLSFVAPPSDIMGAPGNKVSAWNVAVSAGTPVMPATLPFPTDKVEIHRMV